MSKERELLERIVDYAYEYLEIDMDFIPLIQKVLAQPEQEPVAWMYERVNEIGEHVKSVVYNFYDDANLIHLYTAPPKREPLSEEAVSELLMGGFSTHLMDLVRMVEKAHGIGGVE